MADGMLCTTVDRTVGRSSPCTLLLLDGQPCWFEWNDGKSVHSIWVGTSDVTCVCMDEIE